MLLLSLFCVALADLLLSFPAPRVSWLLEQSSLPLGHMGKLKQGTAKHGCVVLSCSVLPPPQALSSPAPCPHHSPITGRTSFPAMFY